MPSQCASAALVRRIKSVQDSLHLPGAQSENKDRRRGESDHHRTHSEAAARRP